MKFFFAMIAIFGFTGLVNAWGPGWNESEILAVVTITTDIYTSELLGCNSVNIIRLTPHSFLS